MTIQLLTLLENNPQFGYFPNEGMTENEILFLEKKFNEGKTFPKSLREYLFLAGKNNSIGHDDDTNIETLQEKAKAEMDKLDHQIDRPIFVFHSHNDCESFLFVFLDETTGDPKTYVYQGHFLHLGDDLFEHNGFTFKSLVEERIDRLLKGY